MLGKNTILKAIHNNVAYYLKWIKVWMLGKNTILKAIHNQPFSQAIGSGGVNAG